jgi:hypothetical protein
LAISGSSTRYSRVALMMHSLNSSSAALSISAGHAQA